MSVRINTLEQTMQNIFNANSEGELGVNFNFSGPADYSLVVTTSGAAIQYSAVGPPSAPPPNAVGVTPTWNEGNVIANYGFVFFDRAMALNNTPTSVAVELGEAGAHEAGHYLLHIGDSPNNLGIMAPNIGGKNWYPAFSGGNQIMLQDKCNSLHRPTNNPNPTAGGVGGGVNSSFAGGGTAFWFPVYAPCPSSWDCTGFFVGWQVFHFPKLAPLQP